MRRGPTDRQLLEKFSKTKDQGAFTAIMQRHGPMVMGVCRRILHNHQDAEDAFQATFLVLARKADSLDRPELLANWLYGVAYRTAQQARAKAARRCHHEREASSMAAAWSDPEVGQRELRELLDEELFQLPEKYRAPLVLCYLEGKTNEEAARLLGWPSGSMSARLARGREMLRDRLASRRSALAGVLPMALAGESALGAIPAELAELTAKAAVDLAADQAIPSGLVSSQVWELVDSVLPKLHVRPAWTGTLASSLFVTLILGIAAATTFAIDSVARSMSKEPPAVKSSSYGPGPAGKGACPRNGPFPSDL